MGDVYRAPDTRLERDVAIKVLPPASTAACERLARFEREARMVAALNHPHIAAIYGVEESEGVRGLVLELVEGDTLAERLARVSTSASPGLPLAEALEYARQSRHAGRASTTAQTSSASEQCCTSCSPDGAPSMGPRLQSSSARC
jgi:serine/threonine protein kinase